MKKLVTYLSFFLIVSIQYLFAGTYSGGDGSESNPYQLSTPADLIELSISPGDWTADFKLTNDIVFDTNEQSVDWDGDGTADWDVSDQPGFSPVGNSTDYFQGNFNGQGYKIDNLFINRPTQDYIGLFGYILTETGEHRTIQNLGVTNVDITGQNYVGAFSGKVYPNKLISGVYTTGIVNGADNVGGLIGLSRTDVMVNNNSNSSCTVNGANFVGGLIGAQGNEPYAFASYVQDSYSTGNVTGTGNNIGGLVGYNTVMSTITDCYTTGSVTGDGENVGGLVGKYDNPDVNGISGCYSTSDVTGNTAVGGLIGFNQNTENSTINSVTACHSSGSVNGTDNVGGLIGHSYRYVSFDKCYSNSNVTGETSVGGLVGFADYVTSAYTSYSTGDVTCTGNYAGGFIGWGRDGFVITNCYTTSNVNGDGSNVIGGFMGRGSVWEYGGLICEINNCFSTGTVSGTGSIIGGFAGGLNDESITINNSFWDTQTSGQSSSAGGTGKTTAEMKEAGTYISQGWDFSKQGNIWAMNLSMNDGYPFLRMQEYTPQNIWLGTSSSNWNTATNWSEAEVQEGDIIIAQTIAKNSAPVIGSSTSATCQGLKIETGALLTVEYQGSLITYGAITNNGTVNIIQTLTDDGKWHFISMPNSTTQASDHFDQMYLQQWIEGDGTEAGWQDIVDPETTLEAAKGYSLWVPASAKMDFTYSGTPNTGDQSIAITASGTGTHKWMNFVGNPYPSYLDWAEISGYGTKYTWNGIAYETHTEAGFGNGSQYVNPMEAFFIYKDAGVADNFTLNDAMRCHQPAGKSGNKALENGLVLEASNGSYQDALWIAFDEDATEGFELSRDAWKIHSGTEGLSQLWSISGDGNLAVDVRPETEIIQLGFTNDQPGTYSIGIKEIADIPEAWLEDTKTNTFHDLSKGAYEFAWNITDNEKRFKLHLNSVGIEENQFSESDILIYAANNQIFIKNVTGVETDGRPSILTVSDLMGRVVLQQEISGEGLISVPLNLQTGVYIVTVENGKELKTEKVFIK